MKFTAILSDYNNNSLASSVPELMNALIMSCLTFLLLYVLHTTSYGPAVAYSSRMFPYSVLFGLQVWLTGTGVFIAPVLQGAAVSVWMEKMDKVIHILITDGNITWKLRI